MDNKTVKYLHELANHFEYRDWNYTRKTNIKSIRYDGEVDRINSLKFRLYMARKWAFEKTPDWIIQLEGKPHGPISRFRMAMHSLKREPNLPDGVLDGGNVITFWEETGEYLNLVQPTVGSLVAEFLMAEPDHPHAKLIIKELERLHRNYKKRIKAGEVR